MRCLNSVVSETVRSGTKAGRMPPPPDGDDKGLNWREGRILRATLINGKSVATTCHPTERTESVTGGATGLV